MPCLSFFAMAGGDDADVAPERDLRGWAIRRGHRRRLAAETGRESTRGRTTFSRSVNSGTRRYRPRTPDHAVRSSRVALKTVAHDMGVSSRGVKGVGISASAVVEVVEGFLSWESSEEMELGACLSVECYGCDGSDDDSSADWALLDDTASWTSETSVSAGSGSASCSTVASAAALAEANSWRPAAKEVPTLPARPSSAWEEAQARAEAGATRYRNVLRWTNLLTKCAERTALAENVEKPRCHRPAKEVVDTPPRVPHGFPALPKERCIGQPTNKGAHDDVLAWAACAKVPKGRDVPACWDHGCNAGRIEDLPAAEYEAVTQYFKQSIQRGSCSEPKIVSLERLQNAGVYARYKPGHGESETVMFHGCRTLANETSILAEGFQVRCCSSGGPGFGTWFAYNADYSNGGYVYRDPDGVAHIFVCVVSNRYIVHDTTIMRVVAQDCAYPLWLLRYKVDTPVRVHTLSPAVTRALQTVSPFPPVRRKRRKNPQVTTFHEVRAGHWVKLSIEDKR